MANYSRLATILIDLITNPEIINNHINESEKIMNIHVKYRMIYDMNLELLLNKANYSNNSKSDIANNALLIMSKNTNEAYELYSTIKKQIDMKNNNKNTNTNINTNTNNNNNNNCDYPELTSVATTKTSPISPTSIWTNRNTIINTIMSPPSSTI